MDLMIKSFAWTRLSCSSTCCFKVSITCLLLRQLPQRGGCPGVCSQTWHSWNFCSHIRSTPGTCVLFVWPRNLYATGPLLRSHVLSVSATTDNKNNDPFPSLRAVGPRVAVRDTRAVRLLPARHLMHAVTRAPVPFPISVKKHPKLTTHAADTPAKEGAAPPRVRQPWYF